MADLNTYTLYDHIELSGVMSEAVDFKPQLLNHFGSRINTDEDTINLDKIVTDARIAIYVDPQYRFLSLIPNRKNLL
jgi:hypothetical protein